MKRGFLEGLEIGASISGVILLFAFLRDCYICTCSMFECYEYYPGGGGTVTIVCIVLAVVIVIVSSIIGLLHGKIQDDQYKKENGIETSKERKQRLKKEKITAIEKNREEELKRKVFLFNDRVWRKYNYIRNTPFETATLPSLKYSNDNIRESILVVPEKFNERIIGLTRAACVMRGKEKALYDDVVENLEISIETINKYMTVK